MADQEKFGRRKGRHRGFQVRANLLFHVAMTKSILITGGARSGKSALAERMTLALGTPAIYIATAEAWDAEMEERIARHRARRGAEWETVAEPLDLVRALTETDGGRPRLVDCVTLWLSNLMLGQHDLEAEVSRVADLIPRLSAPVVFVTNEVGSGIVPDNALARAYRDAAGIANQRLAAACDELWLCVSGHPLKVKPQ
jgi:adenosylcobinamide kinase/adenosylcobinamide-phosphate guanylyltransferase